MEEPFFYQNASLLNVFAFLIFNSKGANYSIMTFWETLVDSLHYKAIFLWYNQSGQAETSVMETYMSEHKSEREHSHSRRKHS